MNFHAIGEIILVCDIAALACVVCCQFSQLRSLKTSLSQQGELLSNMARGNISLRAERDSLRRQVISLGGEPVAVTMADTGYEPNFTTKKK